jgi:hypothetical protein
LIQNNLSFTYGIHGACHRYSKAQCKEKITQYYFISNAYKATLKEKKKGKEK